MELERRPVSVVTDLKNYMARYPSRGRGYTPEELASLAKFANKEVYLVRSDGYADIYSPDGSRRTEPVKTGLEGEILDES